jgi:high affinity Mn2+ porin
MISSTASQVPLPANLPPPVFPPLPVGTGYQDPPAKKNPDGTDPKKNGNGKDDPNGKNGKEKDGKDDKNGKDDKDDKDKDKDKKDDEDKDKFKLLPDGWNFHGQTTIIPVFDAGFGARYSGPNSLTPEAQRTGTVSADLYLGAPLWKGAEFHTDLLLWQGFGLSNAFGLENSPDNDAYKAGTTDPRFMLARVFVRQTIGLGGEKEDVADGSLTLPGQRDVSRLTITAGRISLADIFDYNTYNHDSHSQFMSWSGTNITWDFPADTIGYTTGIALELNQKDWTIRYGWFQLPGTPNGLTADDRIFAWPVEPGELTSDGEFWKQWGMILELERRWKINDHPGAVRFQAWVDHGYLVNFNKATALLQNAPPAPDTPQGVEITAPAGSYSFQYKYGFGLNWEQEVVKYLGVFGRLGWQDGHVAAAAYSDADWTVQLGLSLKGDAWHRPGDTFGFMGNVIGASSQQQAYLKAGGTGILNGDGNLSYAPELSIETYYDIAIGKNCHLAFDYQLFANPAFNRDRGPVNVFLARLHWEF